MEIEACRETVTRELARLRMPYRHGELPPIRAEGRTTLSVLNLEHLKQLCEI